MASISLQRSKQWLSNFWSKVKKTRGCWVWYAARNNMQYGQIFLNGKVRYAHRISYEIANGPIRNGLWVLHSCDNPPCVNPNHLFLGTHTDNVQDCIRKGRDKKAYGEKAGKTKLRTDQVLRILSLRGKMTQREIGEYFGVDHTTVGHILRRTSWAHL